MRNSVIAVLFLSGGAMFAELKAPIATVMSRAPFAVQGVSVSVVGSTSWPAMEGDVIETKSAPAEVRMKDGTRIYMPASSRLVVSRSMQMAAVKPHNGFVSGVMNILDGGAFVVKSSMLEEMTKAANVGNRSAAGNNPATISMVGLLATYGVNSPIVAAINDALTSVGAVLNFNPANNTYYITGVQVAVGNGPPQLATFVISATQISVLPGTITPTTPNPPPPLVIVIPPSAGSGGSPPGCKGISHIPANVSPVVVHIPFAGAC